MPSNRARDLASHRGLRAAVFVLALLQVVAHAAFVRIPFVLRPAGAYFLLATALYLIGGLAVLFVSGRLFRIANLGLIFLAIIDDLLIIYTRSYPSIFFGGRILPWSASWNPPGTVQVFVGQVILIIFSAMLLKKTSGSH